MTSAFRLEFAKGEIMSADDRDDTTIYRVVLNHEEQYSIWPADRDLAARMERCGIQRYEG